MKTSQTCSGRSECNIGIKFDKDRVKRSILESTTSICLRKPRYRVY